MKYKCIECGKEFDSPQKLGGHVAGSHKRNNKLIKEKQTKDRIEIDKVCPKCGEIFTVIRTVNKDGIQNISKKEKKFCSRICANGHFKHAWDCKFCNEKFNTRRELDKHIDTDHFDIKYQCDICGVIFDSPTALGGHKTASKLKSDALNRWKEEGKLTSPVKQLILEEQNNQCDICNMKDEWNGKHLVFILDHIDGDANNNKRENLRCVCPNCDSQLDTYKSKNKNSSRRDRKKYSVLYN